jgi:small-conductance mechanosensitive channel
LTAVWTLLLVAVLLMSPPVAAAGGATSAAAPARSGPPPAAAPAAPPAPPATVPAPEVVRQAEEVARLIRELEALVVPGPVVETIEKRLPEMAGRVSSLSDETARRLHMQAPSTALDELTAQWRTSRSVLTGYVDALAQRAKAIEDALDRLTTLRETWTRARADARASRAPGAVIERIDGVLTAVGILREQMQAQRAATLVLQDRVAREIVQCDTELARIAAARADVAGRLLEQDSVPIWNLAELARGVAELPERVREAVAADAAQLRQFGREHRRTLLFQLVLCVALILVMRAAGRTVTDGVVVFQRPISAAVLLTLLGTGWIHMPAPRAVLAVGEVVALLPALRLMRLLVTPQFTPKLYVLGVLFLADLIRHFAAVVPLLEQQIFLLEMLAAIAVLAWQVVSKPQHRPIAMRALIATFAVAFGAAMAGYMRLGLLLGAGVLGSGYLAVILYAGVSVAHGLVMVALRTPPLSRLGMVRRRGPIVERRVGGMFRLLAIAAWVVFTLRYLGFWNTALDLTQAALGAEFKRGSISVSLSDVLVFVVTVAGTFVVSGLIRFALDEELFPRLRVGRALPSAISTLLHYAILMVGFLLALAALGVDLTKVTILAGAFGVGIGFGLQGIVNNFVSGLILLVERRIDVGDAVQIGDVAGQVKQMGMRACTVRTWEGADVIVPNASLVSERVANWTLSDRLRRVDVPVGIAYGTAPEKVMELLLGVARANKQVRLEPAPLALFLGFGDSALRFELRAWTYFELAQATQSDLAVAVYEALQVAGIEIPFPQHEVRLRS